MLWMDASSRALYTVSDCWGDSPSTRARALGVPRPYFMAIVLSLIATLAPALWTGGWVDRAQRWGLVFAELLALTMVAIAITCRVPRYRDAPFPVAERIKPE